MALFGRGGQTGRERRAMRTICANSTRCAAAIWAKLGQMTVEMASVGSFDRRQLSEQAAEVAKIDREADLIARSLGRA